MGAPVQVGRRCEECEGVLVQVSRRCEGCMGVPVQLGRRCVSALTVEAARVGETDQWWSVTSDVGMCTLPLTCFRLCCLFSSTRTTLLSVLLWGLPV